MQKRGQSPFAGTARRVHRPKGDCPLFRTLRSSARKCANAAGAMPASSAWKRARTSRAARGAGSSGTVGPEAIRLKGLPNTSEITSATSRPARQLRKSPPPLIRLNGLRTVLSSSIFAPAALRYRVMASLSASETPSTGAGISAEPPPETRHKQRSSGPKDPASRKISSDPARPAGVGSFTPGGRAGCRWMRLACPVQSAGTLTQPTSSFSAIHSGPKTASTASAMPAAALPPPKTAIRRISSNASRSGEFDYPLPITSVRPSTRSHCGTSRLGRTASTPASQISIASRRSFARAGCILPTSPSADWKELCGRRFFP